MESNTNLIVAKVTYSFKSWGISDNFKDADKIEINVVVVDIDDASSMAHMSHGCWGDVSVISVEKLCSINTIERDAMIYIAENFMERRESYII